MNAPSNRFPILYHTHHQNATEDLAFWQSLARWQGDPILELGCGTGRVLLPLAQDGHTIYGLDNSPNMLAFLRRSIPLDLTTNIHIIDADMTDFDIDVQFRLTIMPCNTYSNFASQMRLQILKKVHKHLTPGGLFVASMPNPTLLAALQTNDEPEVEAVFTHPESGHPVQVSSTWIKKEHTLVFYWHYDHLYPDGQIERLTATTQHYLDSVEDYITEMISLDFKIHSIFRNFETGPYKPDSSYLIILAQK